MNTTNHKDEVCLEVVHIKMGPDTNYQCTQQEERLSHRHMH